LRVAADVCDDFIEEWRRFSEQLIWNIRGYVSRNRAAAFLLLAMHALPLGATAGEHADSPSSRNIISGLHHPQQSSKSVNRGSDTALDRVTFAVDGAESSHGADLAMWRPDVSGPQGPMQVSQAAALDIGGGDRFDLTQNRAMGRAYLARLYRRYKNWPDAIAAYNWGASHVDNWINTGRLTDKLVISVAAYTSRVLRDSGVCDPTDLRSPQRSLEFAEGLEGHQRSEFPLAQSTCTYLVRLERAPGGKSRYVYGFESNRSGTEHTAPKSRFEQEVKSARASWDTTLRYSLGRCHSISGNLVQCRQWDRP
jgi:hypothetical protein